MTSSKRLLGFEKRTQNIKKHTVWRPAKSLGATASRDPARMIPRGHPLFPNGAKLHQIIKSSDESPYINTPIPRRRAPMLHGCNTPHTHPDPNMQTTECKSHITSTLTRRGPLCLGPGPCKLRTKK